MSSQGLIQRKDLVAAKICEDFQGLIVEKTALIGVHWVPIDPIALRLEVWQEFSAYGPVYAPASIMIVSGYGQGYYDVAQAAALYHSQFGFFAVHVVFLFVLFTVGRRGGLNIHCMAITTTFVNTTTVTVEFNTGSQVSTATLGGFTIVNGDYRVSNTLTNWLVDRVRDFYSRGPQGYGIGTYFTLPVNTQTRVTTKTLNSLLTDLDLVYRHISNTTVTNTQTNLTALADALVVSTGTTITANTWRALVESTEDLLVNRYNVHPGQLVNAGPCDTVYDQGLDTRTQVWGTGSDVAITHVTEIEWPKPWMADSFFNLGSQLVITPFVASMGLQTTPTTATAGLSYTFQCANINAYINLPLTVNNQSGGGRGPLHHVSFAQDPYGPARDPGSTDYLYQVVGGPGISQNSSLINQDPTITGTPFQLVGLHYGDYTTKLVIGVRQGQTVPTLPTRLRVSLDGGTQVYEVSVPGFLDRYNGVTGGLTGVNGWWTQELIYDGESYVYQDRQVSWIEIYTGRKGPDPLGLQAAIQSLQPHTLTILPVGASGVSTGLEIPAAIQGSTVSNAWAQFIDDVRASPLIYDRTQWANTVTAVATVTYTAVQGDALITVAVERNSTVGQSRRLTVRVTATNFTVGSSINWDDTGYSYTTSSFTCTQTTGGTDYGGSAQTDLGGGSTDAGGTYPPWIDPIFIPYDSDREYRELF